MGDDENSDDEKPVDVAPDEQVEAPRVALRVLAKGEDSPDQRFWVERLKEYGIDVLSAGASGIDAEGPVEALEKALDLSFGMDGGTPELQGETTVRSSEEADPPIAYIPTKPTFFP